MLWIRILIVSILLLTISVLSVGCKTECKTDTDCVPATCCHADSCVSQENKPDCSLSFCTKECAPDTLDCGHGSCLCQNSKCISVIG